MATFDKFKPLGFDPFQVTNSAGNVIDEMKARDKAMVDNVEGYTNAIAEMDKLRGGVEAILSNYDVDDKGSPSQAAPKYVHDAYSAAKKEGGLARMSKSQLSKVLQGYTVEGEERKARNEERKIRNDEIDLQSQMRLRMQQGQLAEMQAREREYEMAESRRNAPLREAERLAALEGQRLTNEQAALRNFNTRTDIDTGDFLQLATDVGTEFATEVNVQTRTGGFDVDGTTILGFSQDGRPYFGSVNKRLTEAQLMEQVGETGQTRGDIIRGLLEKGESSLPNAVGIDSEEQQALADVMGIETPEVQAFKEEMNDTLQSIARNLNISDADIPALAAVISEDNSNELYGRGVEIIWNRYKNDPTVAGPLTSLIEIKNGQYNALSNTARPTYLAKNQPALTKFLLKMAGEVTLANGQAAGVDESQTVNRISGFGDVFKDYRAVRNGIAITRAEAVADVKNERVLQNLIDSEAISKAQYAATVEAWRAQNPDKRVPISYSAFAIATMSNVTRTVTELNPDGSVKSTQQFVNIGGINNPKWERANPKTGQTAVERLAEATATAEISAMDFGEVGNPEKPPKTYGDLEFSGVVTRNAGGLANIQKFEEAANNYGQFVESIETLGDMWDEMSIIDIIPTDANKVINALTAIAQMGNKEMLVGTGTVTQLDMEALQDAMKSPKRFASWINSGGNRKALRALASKMKVNITNRAKSLGLEYRDATPTAEVQQQEMDADYAAEAAQMNKVR